MYTSTINKDEKIKKMLNQVNTWQDCVFKATVLEREDKSDEAVSLLRTAEKKFPESKHFLHKNLFELMRRQKNKG